MIGNIAARPVEMPMVGRACVLAELLGTDQEPYAITNAYKIVLEFRKYADDTAALFSLDSSLGEVTVLETLGYIYAPLSDVNKAFLPQLGSSTMMVKLVSVADATVIGLVNLFYLIPLKQSFSWDRPTEVYMALSTTFKNTAKSALGEAYLDTVLCVNQPVGCSLEIYIDGDQPPQNWILVASTAASVAGATRRCIDYAPGTNEKVWFRE
jgi:hypothetical protein